jgi:hypothetical protein
LNDKLLYFPNNKRFRKLVSTYDEDKGDYIEKFIFNDGFYHTYKPLPIEDFELSNVESKYVYIQNLIKDIINELEKTQFIIE